MPGGIGREHLVQVAGKGLNKNSEKRWGMLKGGTKALLNHHAGRPEAKGRESLPRSSQPVPFTCGPQSPCSSFREEVQPGPSPAPPAPPAGCLSPRTFGRIATYLRTPWSRSALALSLDYDTPALSRERGRKQDLPKKGRRKRAELHSNNFFLLLLHLKFPL